MTTKSPSNNMKPREVKCIRCRQHWITDEVDAQCPDCKIPAITVVKSAVANNELGSTSS